MALKTTIGHKDGADPHNLKKRKVILTILICEPQKLRSKTHFLLDLFADDRYVGGASPPLCRMMGGHINSAILFASAGPLGTSRHFPWLYRLRQDDPVLQQAGPAYL